MTVVALLSALFAATARAGGEKGLPRGAVADRIVVEKSVRRLTLIRKGAVLKRYGIALGGNPTGDKEREGDNRTPEGTYRIDGRNAHSRFHRALHISYPTPAQVERAKALGVAPGGAIMIHGLPPSLSRAGPRHRSLDWTAGCIAVTNGEIDELWRIVPDGTTVEIRP